jgi:hypothetical protein
LLVASCRFGFDPISDSDASGDGGPLGAWSAPVKVSVSASGAADDDPALPADMLEIIFDSERISTEGSLFSSKRASVTSPWSTPELIVEIDSPNDEDGPVLSGDGLTLTFSSNRVGGAGMADFYITTRTDRSSSWAPPTRIGELCTPTSDEHLFIAEDGLTAWFMRGPTTAYALMVTTRARTSDPWSTPVSITELTSGTNEQDPWVGPSQLVMYFSSRRTGNDAIYFATRATTSDPWNAITRIVELDTAEAEQDEWVSPDQRVMYFSRGAGVTRDVFMTQR